MCAFSGVRQLLLSIFHKIVSATCGKNIRLLDTEMDIRMTMISVAALSQIKKICTHVCIRIYPFEVSIIH